MTKGNRLPCDKCGTSEWYAGGECIRCTKERGKKRYESNKEAVNYKSRIWHVSNPDKVKEKARKYQNANRDKVRAACRNWTKSNPEKDRARVNKRRARKAGNGGGYTADEFKQLCDYYKNRCLRCGRSEVKLTADHILPVTMGGTSNIDNIQPLCKSCNSWKKDRHIDYRTKPGVLRWIQQKLFG